MTTTPLTSPQPPEGHEILPAPFLRQYGIPANAKWRRTNVNTQWYDASVPRGSDYYPADAEKELTDYIWCAPLGTMAAATTPLPVRECDCHADHWLNDLSGGIAHTPSCSIHLPPYRHILPGALAALPEKPEGLLVATRGQNDWREFETWPPVYRTIAGIYDFAYAIPAPSVPVGPTDDEDKCEDCDPSFTCWGNESQCRKRPKTIVAPEGQGQEGFDELRARMKAKCAEEQAKGGTPATDALRRLEQFLAESAEAAKDHETPRTDAEVIDGNSNLVSRPDEVVPASFSRILEMELRKIDNAIQQFEDKHRGIPQAQMAAKLVKELRALLA